MSDIGNCVFPFLTALFSWYPTMQLYNSAWNIRLLHKLSQDKRFATTEHDEKMDSVRSKFWKK